MTTAEASHKSLGVLGGTFNPPHVGHLALARAAADELKLERVLLVPARVAPHKHLTGDPGAHHRLAMCRLLSAEDARLEVCELELDRPGPSYTVDTLQSIHANHPSAQLILIVGADMARTLPAWRQPRQILQLAKLAVAERPQSDRGEVLQALRQLDGEDRTTFLAMPPVRVSSSAVRERLCAGQRVDRLLTGQVAGYIAAHGLYREGMACTDSGQPSTGAHQPVPGEPAR